jgi:hypothetical protein
VLESVHVIAAVDQAVLIYSDGLIDPKWGLAFPVISPFGRDSLGWEYASCALLGDCGLQCCDQGEQADQDHAGMGTTPRLDYSSVPAHACQPAQNLHAALDTVPFLQG